MPTFADDKGGLSLLERESEPLDWLSAEPGLIQILTYPSRQAVTTDSRVNIKPERGSGWTLWQIRGESLGTTRMLGAGWRVPTPQLVSQWADWLPLLIVGDPPGGRRIGTTISSISRSHKSNCASCLLYKFIHSIIEKKKAELKKKRTLAYLTNRTEPVHNIFASAVCIWCWPIRIECHSTDLPHLQWKGSVMIYSS